MTSITKYYEKIMMVKVEMKKKKLLKKYEKIRKERIKKN